MPKELVYAACLAWRPSQTSDASLFSWSGGWSRRSDKFSTSPTCSHSSRKWASATWLRVSLRSWWKGPLVSTFISPFFSSNVNACWSPHPWVVPPYCLWSEVANAIWRCNHPKANTEKSSHSNKFSSSAQTVHCELVPNKSNDTACSNLLLFCETIPPKLPEPLINRELSS